jgi:hypothetical protein
MLGDQRVLKRALLVLTQSLLGLTPKKKEKKEQDTVCRAGGRDGEGVLTVYAESTNSAATAGTTLKLGNK